MKENKPEETSYEYEEDYDWDLFYARESKIIKCAWAILIGIFFVVLILSHYQVF